MAYRRKDGFYTRAKKEGYRSRAAFKLLELCTRYRLVRRGDRVVDLGAWPGGWLQVASKKVGSRGCVIGVDLVPINPLPQRVVTCLTGDVRDPAVLDEVLRLAGARVDVVLSDMAPKLTGIRATDIARTMDLAQTAFESAGILLRPGGRFLLKTFVCPEIEDLVRDLRTRFDELRRTRPEATRSGSAEIYILGRGFRTG